ncbi:MAG TPA: UDP-N-acetylmuramoyl-L-alanine--D-glutamate ligase [Ktedonobacteraceae bacterium]|nr:UDP-N-acetylmuramoyl-L-alanine--D-glutamate ligase [Ktedonobacteraceae bacterium]
MDFQGKRTLIMGLGVNGSGIASARYAAQHGAIVRVTDLRPAELLASSIHSLEGLSIEYVLGQHRSEDFLWAEIVIPVPGVKRNSPYLRMAREHGAYVVQEIALFFEACPGRTIGITGTRGKTTTTTLIYEMIRAAGRPAVLGGNVSGVETLSLLPAITPATQVVLELSCWQLSGLEPFKRSPSVAVMTNVYADHLDTYDSMEDYIAAKANIFRHQSASDLAIFNFDNPITRRLGEEAPSVIWFTSLKRGGSFARGSSEIAPFAFTDTPLPGRHNLENILLATTTARLLGISDDVIASTVKSFRGVPHRLQEVAIMHGVRYVNDSASTMPVAGQVALQTFHEPLVLVAGGNTKHLPLGEWPRLIARRCRDVVLLKGTGTDELLPVLREEVNRLGVPDPVRGVFDNFTEAMDRAVSLTRPGDIVLFSPGFTSFGMFLNEFDRGDTFVTYVRNKQIN